jgi:peptide/nickel transport system permease protein
MGHVLQGNLGQSFTTHQSTTTIISESFPIDLELIIFSQILAFAIAFPMAMRSARRPNKLFDQASNGTTFAMLALPPFVIAPVLVLIFAVHWHVFPGPASYVPLTQDFWSNIHTMLLPSIVLALGGIVVYFRLLRNDLISTLQEDFITMARSKGLSDRRIMWRHALRPSSISMLASAGVTISTLIAGTFVVELLLQMPGLGYQLVSSVNQDDYTVVQGITLVVAIAIVLINFIFDFLFTIVDPRISRE